MPRAYVYATVEEELRIKELRDVLWNVIDAGRFYKKKDPHITVIPPFSVMGGHKKDVLEIVGSELVSDKKVEIETIGVYENIHIPYVVLLRVNADVYSIADNLRPRLERYTDNGVPEPVTPHITLFKTQGWWDEIDDELKDELQQEIMHRNTIRDTTMDRLYVEFKS